MQLTASMFRHQIHLSSIAAPQIGVHRRVRDSKYFTGLAGILPLI